MNATKVSISTAVFLAVFKAGVGIWSGSLAVLSSAFDSLLDIISSTVNFYAIRLSMLPPDENHPYGHNKFEPLAAQIQSFIILFSGVYILYKAYMNFHSNVEIKAMGVNIAVMAVSICITASLVYFLKYAATKLKSSVLYADSLHYKTDLLSGAGILVALVIIKFTGLYVIDSIVSAVIAVYIIVSALKLNFQVTRELLDETLPEEDMQIINSVLDRHKVEIVDVHKLRTRSAGSRKFIDMHLVLFHSLSLQDGNDIRKDIEKRIKAGIKDADVNIYIEPCDPEHCETCRVCGEQDGSEPEHADIKNK
ncbi:cation diffusion facilitator family transporter [Seleniivibrio woodruffii]|uniref:cation diffusion facilitator family transporter n=1 Tax=Seleniivibrio woodruffii TaxID=1078050 RepID=UPI0024C06D90|nr:cation diffusion facilitator family transporter [Seleniivibrio woodruffii]